MRKAPDSSASGVAVLAIVAVGNVVLWLVARPDGQPGGRFLGELCGVEAVLLFSMALVLATLLPGIERAFGGLDRVALWHRRLAVGGVVLLIPHLAFVTSPADPYSTGLGNGLGDIALAGLVFLSLWALAPGLRAARWPGPVRRLARATYERWLTAHRLTGLFVVAAVAHGVIDDPVMHHSTLLLVAFLIVGGTGIGAYAYRELFARYVIPIHDYTVADLRRLNESTLAVNLDPLGEPLAFVAGQFVFLAFGGPGRWQRHPFSVSSAPSKRRLEVTVKAVGDYTSRLADWLRPGLPAKLVGPFGGFDFRHGDDHQIWIAGGIGITPFVSWIRSLDGTLDRSVDLYYCAARRADAIYLDEILATTEHLTSLRLYPVFSDTDSRLTADRVMQSVPAGVVPSVYMCGPPPMMKAFAKGFRRLGVPADHVRWEQFGAR